MRKRQGRAYGACGAWQGFEATRRAKLATRTARERAAAHAHTKQPGPPDSARDARNTRGAATPHSSPAAQHAA